MCAAHSPGLLGNRAELGKHRRVVAGGMWRRADGYAPGCGHGEVRENVETTAATWLGRRPWAIAEADSPRPPPRLGGMTVRHSAPLAG